MAPRHYSVKWFASLALFVILALALALQAHLVSAQDSAGGSSEAGQQQVRARVISQDDASLSAAVSGRIERFHVREGERIRSGQVLMALDCSVAEAQLAEAIIELEVAQQNRAAREQLAETRSVGELELELARISVRQAQASIDVVEAQLGQCQIKAPFSGVVSKRHFNQAEFVRAGEPVLDVLNDTRLEAEFLVPSRWLPEMVVGNLIDIQLDELDRSVTGVIHRLGVSVNPVSQSLLVVAQLSGDLDDVRVGMSGTVRFKSE